MHRGFRVTLEDGTKIESHSPVWNEVKDHMHALSPHNEKKWKTYEIVTDDGPNVLIDFNTGMFVINGVRIHVADESGLPLTHLDKPQNFKDVGPKWKFLNGLNYFPVVGRRQVRGDRGEATLFFAGWKIIRDKKKYEKLCFMYPNGEVVIQ